MSTDLLVAATRRLPEACEKRIEQEFRFRHGDDEAIHTPASLAAHAQGAAALIVTPMDRIDAATIRALPASVRIISTCSVGYEHIDLEAARRAAMRVTYVPGVMTEATADIALLLILAASRRAWEATRTLREGRWSGIRMTSMLGVQITGKRLGIVGFGRIGAAVAVRAQACGMQVLYYGRSPNPDAPPSVTYVPTLEDLLRQSDVLSLHCPLTPETKGLLNRERISLLPDGAILINTARGGIVDDDALIEALTSRKLFAAGLDVYANEPALDQRYLALDNVFLLPHLGSATVESRTAMGMAAIDNVEAVLRGEEPPFAVV